METFSDAAGRKWQLPINGATIERVREQIGVDLCEYGMQSEADDPRNVLQFRVRSDPTFLTRLLFALVRREADGLSIDYEEFAESMVGDRLWDAIESLETAIVNFTPSPDLREAKRAAVVKIAAMLNKTLAVTRRQTLKAATHPKIDQQHDAELRKYVGKCGNSLDALGSTQEPTPTDS